MSVTPKALIMATGSTPAAGVYDLSGSQELVSPASRSRESDFRKTSPSTVAASVQSMMDHAPMAIAIHLLTNTADSTVATVG